MHHNHWKMSLAFQEKDFMSKMARSLEIQIKGQKQGLHIEICEYVAFLSHLEPKTVKKALEDDH